MGWLGGRYAELPLLGPRAEPARAQDRAGRRVADAAGLAGAGHAATAAARPRSPGGTDDAAASGGALLRGPRACLRPVPAQGHPTGWLERRAGASRPGSAPHSRRRHPTRLVGLLGL